jgi:hypothetical protein
MIDDDPAQRDLRLRMKNSRLFVRQHLTDPDLALNTALHAGAPCKEALKRVRSGQASKSKFTRPICRGTEIDPTLGLPSGRAVHSGVLDWSTLAVDQFATPRRLGRKNDFKSRSNSVHIELVHSSSPGRPAVGGRLQPVLAVGVGLDRDPELALFIREMDLRPNPLDSGPRDRLAGFLIPYDA